jgi:hypothetical protein
MTDNPYLERKNKHKIGKAGRRSETRLAKKIGGRQTPGSGNIQGAKGDIKAGQFLIEAKSTQNESYSLTREVLCKIEAEAGRTAKYPALAVSFITGDGRPKSSGEWVAIPLSLFETLKRVMEDEDGRMG